MSDVDVSLLEHVMVDFAAGEATEHVAPLIERLLADPPAALQACTAVLHACVKVASDSGLMPVAGEGAFYGLIAVERTPGALANLDPLERARHIAIQALTAAMNNDYPAAMDLLVGPLGSSYHESIAAFHQCLVLWRSLANTAGAHFTVDDGHDGTPE